MINPTVTMQHQNSDIQSAFQIHVNWRGPDIALHYYKTDKKLKWAHLWKENFVRKVAKYMKKPLKLGTCLVNLL